MTDARSDLAKITFGVLSIGLLIGSSLWILRPFLGATIWAAMVVVASWPALLWFEARLWRRRSLAVLVMVLILLLLFVLPLTMAISTIAANADEVVAWVRMLISQGPPPLPDWIRQPAFRRTEAGPGVGRTGGIGRVGAGGEDHALCPAGHGAGCFAQAGVVGALTLQFLLTVVIAGVMYARRRSGRRHGAALRPQAGRRSAAKTRSCWQARRSAAWRWAWA